MTHTYNSRALGLLLFAVAILFVPRDATATIHYTISLEHPEQHSFHVTMVVPNVGRQLDVAMPAWNATYDIRDLDRKSVV